MPKFRLLSGLGDAAGMGLIETVLGEVADEALPVSAIVRRIERRHRLSRWSTRSIENTARQQKNRGRLRFVGQDAPGFVPPGPASCMNPVPLELAADGSEVLRSWQEAEPQPPSVREDLLLQIRGSEHDDLPKLDALVRARLGRLSALAEEIGAHDGTHDDVRPLDPDWREQRKLIAQALDASIVNGMLRGLRRAHVEIVEAMERHAERQG
jgi:hypothetical protein